MSRKGENIYKRKDGRWEARVIHHYENGRAKYIYLYGGTYAEVKEKKLMAIKNKPPNTGTFGKDNDFSALCFSWLNSRQNRVKESTYAQYDRVVNNCILPLLAPYNLSQISQEIIDTVFYRLSETKSKRDAPYSDKTIANIRTIFKSIWIYGMDNGYHCCRLCFSMNRKQNAKSINIMPLEKQKLVEEAVSHTDTLVGRGVLFTLFTGVRIGELCGLRWGDIDLKNGVVYIRRTVERIADIHRSEDKKTKVVVSEPKTQNGFRIIPLPTVLLNYMKPYQKEENIYFITDKPTYTEPRTFYQRYKTFLKKNQLGNHTFHELRHTFATQCVSLGFDIKSLSEILGHANVSTTMDLYVHPTLQMKKRQMELLSGSLDLPSKT